MKKSYKHIIILLVASTLWSLLGATCGTVNGVGKDVDSVGDGIQRASRR